MKKETKIFIYVAFKTLFLKSFYNYRTLYADGLCFCLLPDSENFKSKISNILDRHSEFFNTNDHLSGFAIGMILKLEETGDYEKLDKIKKILTSSLGAIGDNLIYKIIRPFIALLLANIFIASSFNLKIMLWSGFLSALLLFTFNFYIRYYGVKKSYYDGLEAIKSFKNREVKILSDYAGLINYILAGILIIQISGLIFSIDKISLFIILPISIGVSIIFNKLNTQRYYSIFVILILALIILIIQ
ncbi:MAG: PTS system mannose/fructose/sorbose family transporter subunit IID [Candidatus Delongbacteria bacterium]|nr:PTS system mannose/fructose/sorbose family transporter subunit IID [Candidatus Delongbacteria bacterium]MBN2835492.1 PTS system mannose/fructose/sorbose family transporter subunit IID [Candidatus Delongbacteria bacterium]